MPLLTPSRVAIILVSLSMISFFWGFGLPQQTGQPTVPIVDHYEHKNVHTAPIIPAPIIETTETHSVAPAPTVDHGERPAEEDDHRWDDTTRTVGSGGAQKTWADVSATDIATHDEDGGRWEDKDKDNLNAPTPVFTSTIPTSSNYNTTNGTSESSLNPVFKFCQDVRGAPHVMVVVRTSKAEIEEKLSSHLLNMLTCVPHFAIFSDHSGVFKGQPVYNALEDISSETKHKHDEFKEYQIMHADPEHRLDAKRTKDLDKWKFLPMVYKAYNLKPDAKFIMFIEADTSLSWTNLLQWISRLDYRIPYYSGAPTFMNSIQLGQRGSGILLSQGALRLYAKTYEELYSLRWEEIVGNECCGDLVLAMALSDSHVEFYPSWPLLQGEHPSTLDYTQKHWCVPAVTWHHVTGDELSTMWDLEKTWTRTNGWEKPYLFRDAFQEFVEPFMEAQKPDWDNLSRDTRIIAPQGRQQQMKEEDERSGKSQPKEEDGNKEDEEAKQKAEVERKKKELEAKKESLEFQTADSESSAKKKRDDDEEEGIDWDKLAETFQDAGDSAERCQKACEQVEDCLQWRYTTNGDGECHLGKVLRLGKKTEGNEKWTSGWLLDRVKNVSSDWECTEVSWKFYQ